MHKSQRLKCCWCITTFPVVTICNQVFPPPQCCRLFWYLGTASSMPSIQCCLAFAILYNRMSRICLRTPRSQSPSLRPTQCLFRIRQEVAAVAPSLIHHLALTLAVHSRCQVRSSSKITFFFSHCEATKLTSPFFCLIRDSTSCLHPPRGADDSGLPPTNGHQPPGSSFASRE